MPINNDQKQPVQLKMLPLIPLEKSMQPVASPPAIIAPATDHYQLSAPAIRPGRKVLVIGDSHTAGTFGTELDRQLRKAGATVATYGSCGTTPASWLKGTATRCGYVVHHVDGKLESPVWRVPNPEYAHDHTKPKYNVIPHPTPLLSDLMQQEHPDVVIVALGANDASDGKAVRADAAKLAGIATSTGAQCIWIGPPSGDPNVVDPALTERVNNALRGTVSGTCTYIDSRPFTPVYHGPDGRHFDKATGAAWADGVVGIVKTVPGK